MHLKLDKQKMEIVAVCGVLESYKPSKEVKTINRKIEALRKKMTKFQEETLEPKLKEIQELIDEENKKYFVEE